MGLVGGASKEAYVVLLEREGGMRAIDIRQVLERKSTCTFTCFTGTNVLDLYLLYWYKSTCLLVQKEGMKLDTQQLYLLYWYKSTNTDANAPAR